MKEEYKLLEDGRVEITFKSESSDLKKIDNETVIGDFYNASFCYLKDKDTCLEDLTEKFDKYNTDLQSINQQLKEITVSDSLAEELKEIVTKCTEMFKAVSEIKDFSNDQFVANNPKKFGKMLKEARTLKENVIGDLKEIDRVTGLHNKREELLGQKKLYSEQVEKMEKQLEQVREL